MPAVRWEEPRTTNGHWDGYWERGAIDTSHPGWVGRELVPLIRERLSLILFVRHDQRLERRMHASGLVTYRSAPDSECLWVAWPETEGGEDGVQEGSDEGSGDGSDDAGLE